MRAARRQVHPQGRRLRPPADRSRPASPAPIARRCASPSTTRTPRRTPYQSLQGRGEHAGQRRRAVRSRLRTDRPADDPHRTSADDYSLTVGFDNGKRSRPRRAEAKKPHRSRRRPTLRIDKAGGFGLPARQSKTPSGRVRRRSPFRRRRRNRPGNAQAKGPLGDDALESGAARLRAGPPTGVTAASTAGNLSGHGTEGAPPEFDRARRVARWAVARLSDRWTMSESAMPAHARFTRCMSSSARAWRRSPATKCRSSIATGILAEHLHTRASAGSVRRLAHGPGACSTAPTTRRPRAALETPCARPISSASRPGGSATRSCSTPTAASSTI